MAKYGLDQLKRVEYQYKMPDLSVEVTSATQRWHDGQQCPHHVAHKTDHRQMTTSVVKDTTQRTSKCLFSNEH